MHLHSIAIPTWGEKTEQFYWCNRSRPPRQAMNQYCPGRAAVAVNALDVVDAAGNLRVHSKDQGCIDRRSAREGAAQK
jgi:hypothetical protein